MRSSAQSVNDQYVESEQTALLESALKIVANESFEMKRALDRNELMDGLKHAAQMLSELRTSALTPKFYYRLYIDVTNELQHFVSYLKDLYLGEDKSAGRVAELYETVQYTGNIIPRLYLLITVGIVYLKSGESPPKDILRDLVEMCRGVQHPLRGLFLRNYLLTSTKELIPDGPAPNQNQTAAEADPTESDGTVKDAIEFIMTNFSEMNKLWVRMQHQGPSREKERRERERRELRILVGTNLVRLSQLEHLDLDLYRKIVLPGILEQAVSCKEPISQEYLMECVIQVFPDSFHLATLEEFLSACAELHADVKIKNILGTLIEHLAAYALADDSPGIPADVHLFDIFSHHAEQMISSRPEMPVEDTIAIQIALLNLALNCYNDRSEFADSVFATTFKILDKLGKPFVPINSVVGRELGKLLRIPVERYRNLVRLLELDAYGNVLRKLDTRGQVQISAFLATNLVENETLIEEDEHLDKIFGLIESLLVDPPQSAEAGRVSDSPEVSTAGSTEDFEEEQNLVAKLVHLVHNEDLEINFLLLNKVRKSFGAGGKTRLRYTLPPTINSTFRLLMRYAQQKDAIENFDARISKIFHFCMNTINAMRLQAEMPEMALRFYLQSALVSDKIDYEKSSSVTYEFISKAFSIYEEEISESREQVQTLTLLIATIQLVRRLVEESHEPLRTQCALYASKLLKRPDQATMLCLVARVFWYSQVSDAEDGAQLRNGTRVLECLKKAGKVASQCMEEVVQCTLYLHILSNYLHFFDEQCQEITGEMIELLVEKIRALLLQLDPSPEVDQLNEQLMNLTRHWNSIRGARNE